MKGTCIQSNRVVLGDQIVPASIYYIGEKIVQVEREKIANITDFDVIDYGDYVIMPGVVDSHVHVNEPGRVEWEGFESATKAAISGGVTTIADMPLNSIPVTTTLEALEIKILAMKDKLWCDVGLLGGVIPGNEKEIISMTERGVLGFKCFTAPSGIDEFPPVNETQIMTAINEGFKKCKKPVIFMFHAEDPNVLEEFSDLNTLVSNSLFSKSNKQLPYIKSQYSIFLSSRPPVAEAKAIDIIINVCDKTGIRCHIVHLSSATCLQMIGQAKTIGVNISVETTPHYLFFTSEEIPEGKTTFKCCPPIRSRENREKLWKGVQDGIIDSIASDHSPCVYDLKKMDEGNFIDAWGGINSLQLGLSILWTQAKQREITIPQLAQKICMATSKLLSIEDLVGSIEVGKLANFVIWNPEEKFTVSEDMLRMKNKKTPYLDQELFGIVEATILRGQKVYHKGEDLQVPTGKWFRPSWIQQ
jgi:allantoinase